MTYPELVTYWWKRAIEAERELNAIKRQLEGKELRKTHLTKLTRKEVN